MPYADIRATLEDEGYRLADGEYMELVAYARRKAACSGKDESYIPLLLPDVIKEHFFRITFNAISALRAGEQYIPT